MLVTVGICAKNSEKTIENCLESILHQDFSKSQMEIIFVEGGSTDKTLELTRRFFDKTELQARIYFQIGLGQARNVVVQNAYGRYIIWVDGDVELPLNHVRKQVEFMELNPKVGAAKARYGFLHNEKLVALLENSRAFDLVCNPSMLFGTGGAIYRVEAIRAVGGFDNKIRGAGEDIDALIRIRKDGWLLSNTDAFYYENYKETWGRLWIQYRWWGFGAHYVKHKYKESYSIAMRLPPVALLIGLLKFFPSFKHTRKIEFVLLPIHSVFKETAFLSGFLQAHLNRCAD